MSESDGYIGDAAWLDIIGEEIEEVERSEDGDVLFDAYARLVDVYRMCREAQAQVKSVRAMVGVWQESAQKMLENGWTESGENMELRITDVIVALNSPSPKPAEHTKQHQNTQSQ